MKNLSKDDVNSQPRMSSRSQKKKSKNEKSRILMKEPLTGSDAMPS